jgi:hypothetical protein
MNTLCQLTNGVQIIWISTTIAHIYLIPLFVQLKLNVLSCESFVFNHQIYPSEIGKPIGDFGFNIMPKLTN